MLFEDFDKKIKEAADQHHPAYDEKAWQKMEKLLNQHLPQQKDDRRRVLFSLLLLILIGGGAYLVISRPHARNDSSPQAVLETKAKDPVEKSNKTSSGLSDINSRTISSDLSKNIGPAELQNARRAKSVVDTRAVKKTVTSVSYYNKMQQSKPVVTDQNRLLTKNSDQEKSTAVTGDTPTSQKTNSADNIRSEAEQGSTIVSNNSENNITKSNDPVAKTEVKTNTSEQVLKPGSGKSSQQKNKLNTTNGFSFFVSAGPDVSKAGDSKTGKTTLLYGAGVGYTRNHITLRTGIYASKKIYWAGSRDYELSYAPTPPTKFEGADANCDVIDIPVKLSYAFNLQNKNNWFAGVGLSSYLMKKEKYVYTYKTAATTFYYPYQTKNENKHYFSILNLSAGYTHHINNTISISVEPYAEIPLTGIGVGKVHLNSGGVLFSVGLRPFKK